MPQAIAVAGIAAGAQIAGGVMQSRAASSATKAQEKARQEALAYERQKEAESQRQRQAHAEAYRKAWLDWYGRVGDEGIRRYGVPVGITLPGKSTPVTGPATRLGASDTVAAPPSATTPYAGASRSQAVPMGSGATLGDLVGMAVPAPMPGAPPIPAAAAPALGTPAPTQGATLGSLSGWEDWNRYGA